MAPTAPGERSLSYKNLPIVYVGYLLLESMHTFSGGGDEFYAGCFSREEFSRIPTQTSFHMSCSFFSVSILRVDLLRIIVRGNFHRD